MGTNLLSELSVGKTEQTMKHNTTTKPNQAVLFGKLLAVIGYRGLKAALVVIALIDLKR